MPPFASLGQNIEALEDEGLLRRMSDPVNKDTELMPLVRCQFRGLPEEERTSWLFDNPTDSRGRTFDIPVGVALLGASRDVYRFNLGCSNDAEVVQTWDNALDNQIEPVLVQDSPVKDVILHEDDISGPGEGMDKFPVPISTPGFDPAPFLTSGFIVTKHPDTDVVNMGTYRCQIKAPDTMGVYFAYPQDARDHWEKTSKRGEPLETAIVIGAPAHVSMVSVSTVPSRQSEFAVCGGLAGEPLELVDCETVDVQVPASAEIVIEGELTPETYTEGPFGEFTGYMGEQTNSPNFEISCITHRRDPIYQAFISQMPPSESSTIRKVGNEQNLLKFAQGTDTSNITDIVLHEASGSSAFTVVQLEKARHTEPWQAMRAVMAYKQASKFTIAVDKDINPHDLESVVWAMSFRVQPDKDIEIIRYRSSPLDPVSAPPDADRSESAYPGRTGDSAVLIDATLPWDYPPTSLPKREFMEDALELWEEQDLPSLELTEPWYGESLGAWTEAEEVAAEMATEGKYYEYQIPGTMSEEPEAEVDEPSEPHGM